MSVIHLLIGGHVLAVDGEKACRLLMSYGGTKPFVIGGHTSEWTVCYGQLLPYSDDFLPLTEFSFAETGCCCRLCRKDKCYQFSMFDTKTATPLVEMQYTLGENSVVASECADISTLVFSLWFAYSMLSAASHLTFVHASSVVYKGRVVLFLGESGTGKSTHARLWKQSIPDSNLLNDDSPIISLSDGHAEVYGSPWSGKTPCYHNLHFPLAAIVRLSQAPINSMRRLSVLESFAALQPSLPPALMQDDCFSDMLNGTVSDVVSIVPIYSLQCLPDIDAAILCHDKVFKNKES